MTRLTDEVLSAYIDGELDPEEAARIASALTQDPAAAARLDKLRKGDALLREAFAWPLPGQADLTDRLAADMKRSSPWEGAGRLALLAAALLGAAAGFAAGLAQAQRNALSHPPRPAQSGRRGAQ